MSGHKRTTVTISQDEYRRLYEAERKSYYDVLAIPEDSFAQSIQRSQDAIIQDFHRIADRQETYEALANSFQTQVREIEKATTQSLVEQQTDFYNSLLDLSESMWENTSDLVFAKSNEFYANVESLHQHLQSEMTRMDEQINWFHQHENEKQQLAIDWLNDATSLHNFLSQTYPAELCDLTSEARHLQLAERNLAMGIYEACIAAAQTTFIELSEKRLACEKILSNRKALSTAAINRLQLLNQRIIANQAVPAIDVDGHDLDELLDVNFWTNGQFKLLQKKCARMLEQVSNAGLTLHETDLTELLDRTIPALTEQLVELIHSAKRNALNAQLRFNIAQLILATAMAQGYQPVSGKYDSNDYRNPYCAVARSRDGSEISIRIEPDAEMQQVLHIESHPGMYQSENEMKRRLVEVIQCLEPIGFQLGQIQSVESNNNPKLSKTGHAIYERKAKYSVK